MQRLTRASAVRIALVLLLGLVVLEYVWVETQPGVRRRGGPGRIFGLSSGCPSPSEAEAHGAADDAWRLQALDGSEVAFEQFRNQVVFVNVWATWCGPCREEMPGIQSLYEALRQDVAFVVVSEEAPEVVQRWIEQQGYTFPVYVSATPLPAVFDTPGIPATFVVNRQGRIVLKRVGARDWNSESCQEFLKALL
jgi:thiol-disulfide isomerase/thioredoxin